MLVVNEEQREILYIIAELSNRSVTNSVRDTAVIEMSGLPAEEVHEYLYQLEGLGYIIIGFKAKGADDYDYRPINLTWEGIRASLSSSSR
jgi:hypothetical protein